MYNVVISYMCTLGKYPLHWVSTRHLIWTVCVTLLVHSSHAQYDIAPCGHSWLALWVRGTSQSLRCSRNVFTWHIIPHSPGSWNVMYGGQSDQWDSAIGFEGEGDFCSLFVSLVTISGHAPSLSAALSLLVQRGCNAYNQNTPSQERR